MKSNIIVKNTSMLYLMNIAKMIFPLLTLPYLTRVLTVECYGIVSYVKAVMQYMQMIIDFGFILSGTRDIVYAKNKKEQLGIEIGNIFFAKILLSILASILLCIVIFFIPILRENVEYVILSFVAVFMTNFLFDYLFMGLEKMEIITIRFVIMKGLATVLTFVFVHTDSDIFWIPILDIIGSFIAVFFVVLEIKNLNVSVCFGSLKTALLKIKNSAVYFFSNIASAAFMSLNTLLIGIFLTKTEIAYWSLCLQMVTAVQALYTPLTDGIYPHMVKTRDLDLLKKAAKIYMPLVTIGCIFTLVMAKNALYLLGGYQYIGAANVLRTLVPVLFFSFLSMLFGWPALGAIGKQKETTFTTIFAATIQVIGLFILIICGKFNLINIAILRGITEFILFSLRFRYVIKFKMFFR